MTSHKDFTASATVCLCYNLTVGREGNATQIVQQQEACPADLLAGALVVLDLVFAGAAEIDDRLAALIHVERD